MLIELCMQLVFLNQKKKKKSCAIGGLDAVEGLAGCIIYCVLFLKRRRIE